MYDPSSASETGKSTTVDDGGETGTFTAHQPSSGVRSRARAARNHLTQYY